MRDAMGGTVVLVVIVVFIVFALGYMAFNVNYTKAFRMKNKIISVYEDYDGKCNSDCQNAISSYAKTIGYTIGRGMSCPNGYTKQGNLYCYQKVSEESHGGFQDRKTRSYYKIITKINVEVPVINNMLNFKIFYITGDTKTFVGI